MLARGFYARREMWTPVIIGTGATIVVIPIYFVLLDAFEVKGLALASTIGLVIYTTVLAVVWYSRTGWDQLGPVLRSVARALPLALLAALAAWESPSWPRRHSPKEACSGASRPSPQQVSCSSRWCSWRAVH